MSTDWSPGTPAHAAMERERAGTETVADVLLLIELEADDATDSLPPVAMGPKPNNCGQVITPDPNHASCCTMRISARVSRIRKLLGILG